MHDWFFRLDRQTGSSFYNINNLAIDETQINRYLTVPWQQEPIGNMSCYMGF
jgi:hypothetical protein